MSLRGQVAWCAPLMPGVILLSFYETEAIVSERPEETTDLTGPKVLIFFCATTLIVPIFILLLCAVLIGLHQYPLPGAFLALYVLACIASPIMGVISLVYLLVRRRTFRGTLNRVERRGMGYLLVLSVLNIFAVVFWFMFFPYLIFSIGGSR